MQQFLELPPAIRNTIALLSCTSIVGAVSLFDSKLALIVGIGMVLLIAAIAGFFAIRGFLRKRRASSMANELNQHSSNAPAGVSDAAGRAELDRLRQKFLEGLSKFGDVANTYKFPWYVVVGEPGSGKTEAIRRCNVGFPPGMQDELQGTGGTINMNWWFTNQAVFLDTAGKMMFKDVKPGETSEWKEFLQLLSRNRPNCPINGLILTIPADALIKDIDNKLHEKASRIAQQFEVIQRTLDIRFPVFVVITKCDLLSGFREFFDDFADVNSVNQMLGWSNPEDRDTPFAPDRVTDHLGTVVDRIKKRRLSILRDPVPHSGDRRADEVDALYALPQSFQLIAPRLRMYLEKIFVAGPWSPKPLFLRGIYFTSSMREGSALDQELALALGITTDNLPEGKVWEKERAYFLRDIFTEKIFREKGLVTRATDTKKMLRTRSLVLWGTASLLALLFVGFTLYAYRQFADSIKQHSDLWTTAKDPADWKARYGNWKPIVSPDKPGDTVVKYRGVEPALKVGSKDVPLLGFHTQLKDIAQKPIDTGWVYRPMLRAANIDTDRLDAQRIVFEASTIFPIVEAARNRMLNEKLDAAVDKGESVDSRFDREAKALLALIRIEADRSRPDLRGKVTDLPDSVFTPLLQYATATRVPASEDATNQFKAAFEYTYTHNPKGAWVPALLDKGSASLAANKPIDAGLGRLLQLGASSLEKQRTTAADVAKLRDDLRAFRKVEEDMNSIAKGLSSMEEKDEKLKEQLGKLAVLKTAIEQRLESDLLDHSAPSMNGAYSKFVTDSKAQSNARFGEIIKTVEPLIKPAADGKPIDSLFSDVKKRVTEAQTNLDKGMEDIFSKDEQAEFVALDAYLADYQDGGLASRVYAGRYATYKKAEEIANGKDSAGGLVGSGWKEFSTVRNSIKDLRSLLTARLPDLSAAAAKTKPLPDFLEPCNRLLESGEKRRLEALVQAYLQESATSVKTGLFFPFVMTTDKAPAGWAHSKAKGLISSWEKDFGAEAYASISDSAKSRLSGLKESLERMKKAPEDFEKISAANKAEKDRFEDDMKGFKYVVSVQQQNKWKTANGNNIYDIPLGSYVSVGSFSYGGSLSIGLSDPATGSRGGVRVDSGDVGTKSSSGVTVRVEAHGTRPKPPQYKKFEPPDFSAPSKSEILQKLQSSGN